MEVIQHELKDVLEIIPDVYEDERGYFFESYNEHRFHEHGITTKFIQDNQSKSQKNVLRGLHFQTPPHAMTKLVRVISGKIIDVIVDLRTNSPTYLKHGKYELSAKKKNMLLVPEGFAHGFLTLEDETVVFYKCSSLYNKESDSGLNWNDPDFNINWDVEEPIVSKKDQNALPVL